MVVKVFKHIRKQPEQERCIDQSGSTSFMNINESSPATINLKIVHVLNLCADCSKVVVMWSTKAAFQCWKYDRIFLLKSEMGSDITVQCKACLPAVEMPSTLKCLMSNLRKHLQISQSTCNQSHQIKFLLSQHVIYVCARRTLALYFPQSQSARLRIYI